MRVFSINTLKILKERRHLFSKSFSSCVQTLFKTRTVKKGIKWINDRWWRVSGGWARCYWLINTKSQQVVRYGVKEVTGKIEQLIKKRCCNGETSWEIISFLKIPSWYKKQNLIRGNTSHNYVIRNYGWRICFIWIFKFPSSSRWRHRKVEIRLCSRRSTDV